MLVCCKYSVVLAANRFFTSIELCDLNFSSLFDVIVVAFFVSTLFISSSIFFLSFFSFLVLRYNIIFLITNTFILFQIKVVPVVNATLSQIQNVIMITDVQCEF